MVHAKRNEEIAEDVVINLATAKHNVSGCIGKLSAANPVLGPRGWRLSVD